MYSKVEMKSRGVVKMVKYIELNNILETQTINKAKLLTLIPELIVCDGYSQNHPAHQYDVLEHSIQVANHVGDDAFLKTVAIFHDIGKPYTFRTIGGITHFWGHGDASEQITSLILRRLGCGGELASNILRLIKHHDIKINPTFEAVSAAVLEVGADIFPELIRFRYADLKAHSNYYFNERSERFLKVEQICIESLGMDIKYGV